MQLTQRLRETGGAGVPVLAVSVDAGKDSEQLEARLRRSAAAPVGIEFLEDRGRRVIDRYGLYNPRGYGNVPHPATYVIDKGGVVRWRFVETNYRVRASEDAVISALRSLR